VAQRRRQLLLLAEEVLAVTSPSWYLAT